MPKYVVSSTLKNPEWNNTTLIHRDVDQAVSKLRRDLAGDLLVNGSIQLVRMLMEHNLVDELRLMVYPTVLGAGKRLFGEANAPAAFKLAETKRAGETMILTLVPLHEKPA
jgi:dihydrofolate reductase